MSPRLFLFTILVLCSLILFFAHHNRGLVSIDLSSLGIYEMPLTVLVIIPLLAGILITLLFATIYDLQRTLSSYRLSRDLRQNKKIREIYDEGMRSLLGKRWAQARQFFRKILLRDPGNIPAFLRLGEISLQEGDYNEAIRLHLKARNLDPDNLEVLMDLETDYERAGQTDEAITILERIREAFKENLAARQKLRGLYIKQGRWDKALEVQQDLLKSSEEATKAGTQRRILLGCRYEIGNAKLAQGEFKEAAKIYREVVKVDKGFLPAYLQLGETYYQSGHKGKAARVWERAFDITRSSAFIERIERLYLEWEEPRRLISFYHQRILRYPQDLSLRFHLGKLYYRLEMIDEAVGQFQILTREVPGFALPHFLLAQIYERRRRWGEALAQLKEALSPSPPLFQYRCSECGTKTLQWQDRCSSCGEWNSLSDELRTLVRPSEPSTLQSPIRF